MPPPLANKSKGKGREVRRSRSRNTTPSSASTNTVTGIGYLDNDISKILVPTSVQYSDILDRLGGSGHIPEPKALESLVEHLKTLSQLAETRGEACNAGIREISQKRKEVFEELREREQLDRDAEERLRMKREADDDEDMGRVSKGGKLKKRKDRGIARDERPLSNEAHGVAKQDGTDLKTDIPHRRGGKDSFIMTSPNSKKAKNVVSSTSSLSPSPSPAATGPGDQLSTADSPNSTDSSDSQQPEPTPPIPQYQVFGPNPLAFDDPTIYHIRDVTPGMTDDEKREIYSVAQFPKSDLSHMMTGTPPDKDFSNAKPTNQVSANTFATYIEPYVRPLTEEDIAFLKERGDRTTPFLLPRRGKKHYTEIWAEEDGSVNVDSTTQDREQLPLNQGRSGIDQMTDEIAETDQISAPPLVSRLYSLLRFEHRTLPEENTAGTASNNEDTNMNGIVNGDTMDIDSLISGVEPETKPLNSATTFVDASPNGFKIPAAKLEHGQLDERLKAELRYVGIFGQDDNPDYDAHYDDDIAERLRLLQAELKKQMIANGARKARLLEIARERLAYQEYSTIHDDLDSQVQQAYLKRTRTLGKSKKGSQAKHKPGGAGGGSHPVAPNASGAGVSRPGIGDVARTLMDRRKRWSDCIGPVFKDCKTTVPGKDESIFDPAVMEEYEKAELEGWDEEQE
ncbi:ada histone acetyltransferase complex component [Histoplasma capsulatum G186AR]|uniref:Ada histone acetyltransferase complex component n=2 Tax=Ajellomyces capsulatus TaxID=5037 RepID=C0NCF3_AJECG|nr:ada histone acetyltransferase complex component [Histoplasma capsulatum G186AR]EEH11344.1 ada histone acetyltransferase complex component [Histoplasma capsulatum G186AR]KAG5302811.1 ada histone acetyltransferase complex component [Histoplasma capsulatum]QSS71789.1 ada histone acetyltransferase complex component [Histoplasma capsulatum G186AR]